MADVLAVVLVLALNAYVLFGGADFGGGVWDLLARGPRAERQRHLIARAIGPVWEANHVWLIIAIVLLFTCFPGAFARVSIVLHIPLALMLVGIVLRGTAFTLRSYGDGGAAFERRWGRTFATASLLTPVLLGVALGAIASGRVVDDRADPASFVARYVVPWTTAFGVGVGVLVLASFAYLAAVYLVLETADTDLREDFRRRGLVAWGAVVVAALGCLAAAHGAAPRLAAGLLGSGWAAPLHAVMGLVSVTAVVGLWQRRYRLARVAAAAQVSLLFWGWALSQRPYVVPPDLTVAGAAAPAATLRLVLIVLAIGAALLIPSLFYLFHIFKSRAVWE